MPLGVRLLAALAALFVLAVPAAANARTLQLGASFEAVEGDYPEARLEKSGADAPLTLRIRDVDHAGVRWALVEFIFDVSNHLSAVRLHTTNASFARVQQLVLDQMKHPEAGSLAADAAGAATMQIRLCQTSDAGVTVTLEHPAVTA